MRYFQDVKQIWNMKNGRKCWKFDHLSTLLRYVPHAACTWKWNPVQKLWFVQSFKKWICAERMREMHFVQRYFIVSKEFMFTWLHPLITTDLILPDRTPVSYWWNTAEICSEEAFIQLWVHHLVTRSFYYNFTIKPCIILLYIQDLALNCISSYDHLAMCQVLRRYKSKKYWSPP